MLVARFCFEKTGLRRARFSKAPVALRPLQNMKLVPRYSITSSKVGFNRWAKSLNARLWLTLFASRDTHFNKQPTRPSEQCLYLWHSPAHWTLLAIAFGSKMCHNEVFQNLKFFFLFTVELRTALSNWVFVFFFAISKWKCSERATAREKLAIKLIGNFKFI